MSMQKLLLKEASHKQISFYQGFAFFYFSYSFYTPQYNYTKIKVYFQYFLIYLSGDNNMNRKFNSGLAIILPNKKINLFVFFIIMLGIISGSIFLIALNKTDKELVINQITTFITNINNNNINNFNAFKNAFISNIIFISSIWILGMSIIGIIINIFTIYLKGFVIGFTLSSFFLVYKYRGLLISTIYLIPSSIINIIIILIIGVYSIILTNYLWKVIFLRDHSNNIRKFLKKYTIIFLISIIFIAISSLCESYLVPALIKLSIKLFI